MARPMKTPQRRAGPTPANGPRVRGPHHATPSRRGLPAALLLALAVGACTGEVPYAADPEHDHASHAPADDRAPAGPPAHATLTGRVELADGVALAPGGEARDGVGPGDYDALHILGYRDAEHSELLLSQSLGIRGLPVDFTLTARHLHGLGTLSGEWWLEARLDHDGDALATRGDVVGRVGPVTTGDATRIVLDTVLTAADETLPLEERAAAPDEHDHAPGHSHPADEPRFHGTIDIDPQFAELAARGTLFVSIKQQPGARGMPRAALRIDGPSFPLALDIGPEHVPLQVENKADMILGELWLTARLDMDGDALSRGPDDVEIEPLAVTAGGEPFDVRLDRRSDG